MGTRTRLLNNVDGDISVGAIVATSITDTSLTAGRVVIVGTGGLLEDDAGLTYDKTTNVLTNTGGGVVITNTGLASATAALTTTGTLSTTNAEQFGVSTTITSAGSGAAALQNAYRITLAAGYTGGAATFGIQAINLVAGTGTGGVVQASANYAIGGSVSVTTAGDNVGVTGSAQGGNKSIGGSFIAATNKAGATNIGVTGLGLNGGGGGAIQIGGYFGLQGSTPTFTSAALMCDNGATTDPIFVGRNNGTNVLVLDDSDVLTLGTSEATVSSLGKLRVFKAGNVEAILRDTTNDVEVSVGAGAGSSGYIGVQTNHPFDIFSNGTNRSRFNADGVTSFFYFMRSVGNALTATGTDRATALQLAKEVNNVTTAAASTGVILPVGVVGMRITVFNAGANPIQVYASASETIDTVAGATGVPLTNAKRADFFYTTTNVWISAQLGVVSA